MLPSSVGKYRANPAGVAHCWIVEERATGRLVCQSAFWPWPLAHALEPCLGYLVGDSVVAPAWQRQGIAELRRSAYDRHPLDAARMKLGWPNERSLGRLRKHGHARQLVGRLLEGVFSVSRAPRRAWRRLLDKTRGRGLWWWRFRYRLRRIFSRASTTREDLDKTRESQRMRRVAELDATTRGVRDR